MSVISTPFGAAVVCGQCGARYEFPRSFDRRLPLSAASPQAGEQHAPTRASSTTPAPIASNFRNLTRGENYARLRERGVLQHMLARYEASWQSTPPDMRILCRALRALTQKVLNRTAMIGIGDPFNADAEAASSSLPATTQPQCRRLPTQPPTPPGSNSQQYRKLLGTG